MNVRSAVLSRLALQRFFARTDFVPSKTSISRRSRPGSAAPFKDSRPDTLAFMLSTLSTERGHLLLFKYRARPHRHIRSMYGRVQPRHPVQTVVWLAKHAFWADYRPL